MPTAPNYLDTSREDWRSQAPRQGNCRACDERVLWCSFVIEGREVWRPYNFSDGYLHFATCPQRHAFRVAKGKAEPNPAPKPKPSTKPATLFDMTPYGVE